MGSNCILLVFWVAVAVWARSTEATWAKGEQMLAVRLVQWERCCLEWLLSELFLVWFCSFIQQVTNKTPSASQKAEYHLLGKCFYQANAEKTELWLPALGSAVPAGDSISEVLCSSTFPYWLVWASQHLVYWQLSISPCSKLKLALQILVLEILWGWGFCIPRHNTKLLSFEQDLSCNLVIPQYFPSNSHEQF